MTSSKDEICRAGYIHGDALPGRSEREGIFALKIGTDIQAAVMKERIEVVKGDITKVQVDAIVNAANSPLGPVWQGGNAHEDELLASCFACFDAENADIYRELLTI